ISSPEQISGLIATQETLEGEQVTARRFSPVAEKGVRGDLKGNLRAVQIQGDANQTLAGTLHDGDHVDLVATFKYHKAGNDSGDTFYAARVVLRNLKVEKAPQAPAVGTKLTNDLQSDYAVMLAVTDQQAQKLLFTTTQTGGSGGGTGVGWSL